MTSPLPPPHRITLEQIQSSLQLELKEPDWKAIFEAYLSLSIIPVLLTDIEITTNKKGITKKIDIPPPPPPPQVVQPKIPDSGLPQQQSQLFFFLRGLAFEYGIGLTRPDHYKAYSCYLQGFSTSQDALCAYKIACILTNKRNLISVKLDIERGLFFILMSAILLEMQYSNALGLILSEAARVLGLFTEGMGICSILINKFGPSYFEKDYNVLFISLFEFQFSPQTHAQEKYLTLLAELQRRIQTFNDQQSLTYLFNILCLRTSLGDKSINKLVEIASNASPDCFKSMFLSYAKDLHLFSISGQDSIFFSNLRTLFFEGYHFFRFFYHNAIPPVVGGSSSNTLLSKADVWQSLQNIIDILFTKKIIFLQHSLHYSMTLRIRSELFEKGYSGKQDLNQALAIIQEELIMKKDSDELYAYANFIVAKLKMRLPQFPENEAREQLLRSEEQFAKRLQSINQPSAFGVTKLVYLYYLGRIAKLKGGAHLNDVLIRYQQAMEVYALERSKFKNAKTLQYEMLAIKLEKKLPQYKRVSLCFGQPNLSQPQQQQPSLTPQPSQVDQQQHPSKATSFQQKQQSNLLSLQSMSAAGPPNQHQSMINRATTVSNNNNRSMNQSLANRGLSPMLSLNQSELGYTNNNKPLTSTAQQSHNDFNHTSSIQPFSLSILATQQLPLDSNPQTVSKSSPTNIQQQQQQQNLLNSRGNGNQNVPPLPNNQSTLQHHSNIFQQQSINNSNNRVAQQPSNLLSQTPNNTVQPITAGETRVTFAATPVSQLPNRSQSPAQRSTPPFPSPPLPQQIFHQSYTAAAGGRRRLTNGFTHLSIPPQMSEILTSLRQNFEYIDPSMIIPLGFLQRGSRYTTTEGVIALDQTPSSSTTITSRSSSSSSGQKLRTFKRPIWEKAEDKAILTGEAIILKQFNMNDSRSIEQLFTSLSSQQAKVKQQPQPISLNPSANSKAGTTASQYLLPLHGYSFQAISPDAVAIYLIHRSQSCNLYSAMKRKNQQLLLNLNERLLFATQICDTIMHLHACRISPINLKPSNILFDSNKNFRLSGWELPRQTETTGAEENLDETEAEAQQEFTRGYTAPEISQAVMAKQKLQYLSTTATPVFNGTNTHSHSAFPADVWSFAMILQFLFFRIDAGEGTFCRDRRIYEGFSLVVTEYKLGTNYFLDQVKELIESMAQFKPEMRVPLVNVQNILQRLYQEATQAKRTLTEVTYTSHSHHSYSPRSYKSHQSYASLQQPPLSPNQQQGSLLRIQHTPFSFETSQLKRRLDYEGGGGASLYSNSSLFPSRLNLHQSYPLATRNEIAFSSQLQHLPPPLSDRGTKGRPDISPAREMMNLYDPYTNSTKHVQQHPNHVYQLQLQQQLQQVPLAYQHQQAMYQIQQQLMNQHIYPRPPPNLLANTGRDSSPIYYE